MIRLSGEAGRSCRKRKGAKGHRGNMQLRSKSARRQNNDAGLGSEAQLS